jgi:hypothetical protein
VEQLETMRAGRKGKDEFDEDDAYIYIRPICHLEQCDLREEELQQDNSNETR